MDFELPDAVDDVIVDALAVAAGRQFLARLPVALPARSAGLLDVELKRDSGVWADNSNPAATPAARQRPLRDRCVAARIQAG